MNNKRAFKAWDSFFLTQMCEVAIQIKHRIEEQCQAGITPADLPLSVIPSSVLYDIASAYEAMYKTMLEEDLISTGYPKPVKNVH